MSVCKRVIARLDIKGLKLIKGKRFEGLRVIGNACDYARKYAEDDIDEIFYADAVASLYQRNSLSDILQLTSKNVFVPITAGGGIRCVQDGVKLLSAGADKLAINTAAVKEPNLINQLAKKFGRQCIVISIQVRRSTSQTGWDVMIESGRERTNKNLFDWIKEIEERGAGEIFITSVDNDGTGNGPDIELINKLSSLNSLPLVIGGGVSTNKDIKNIINTKNDISGIAIGWALHNSKINIQEIKETIKSEMYPMRKKNNRSIRKLKNNVNVAIIDYNMGNIESLFNALIAIGANVKITNNPSEINSSQLLALPGVGSFPEGMKNLESKGLEKIIRERAKSNKGILGICLGMQLLYEEGEEHHFCKGLGIIEGKISPLPSKSIDNKKLILPHIGWNKVYFNESNRNFINIEDNEFYQYFVHSFADLNIQNQNKYTLMESYFGGHKFISGIKKGNTVGLQFHPERSGSEGISFLSSIIDVITKD